MKVIVSSHYSKRYKKVVSNNQNLHQIVKEKLKLLVQNSSHPSLKIHKFQKGKKEQLSMSVNMSLRIAFIYVDNGVLLLDIGTHEDIY